MKALSLIRKITKSFINTKHQGVFRYAVLSSALKTRSFVMVPKYCFSGSKEVPADFAKTIIQGVQSSENYESLQHKTACLGLFSYIIKSNDEVAIIDPLNEIDEYVKFFKGTNYKLKYIFLTHFHADFISGQNDLLKMFPDVKIVMGPSAKTDAFKFQILNDGQSLKLGKVEIEALHTPGHTLESTCFILKDNGKKELIYTGDTVFIGEVGRPDLAAKINIPPEQLAKVLYKSIQRIKALPNEIRVYPGHGAGSGCGKNISKGDSTSIGCQKNGNYAFKAQTQAEFVKQVLHDMPKPPPYYFNSVQTNKIHPFDFEQTFTKVFKPLTIEQFQKQMKAPNTIVLDVRSDNKQFFNGMIKQSYFVGNTGPFANFVGVLFDAKSNILIFGNNKQQEQAIKRLLRIGYINIKGYNGFDISAWKGQTAKYPQATINDLKQVGEKKNDYTILDLRTKPELSKQGVFAGENLHVPIQELQQSINNNKLPKNKKYLLHCASGYRSKIGATMLKQSGYDFKVLAEPWAFYKQKGASIVGGKH